MVAKKDATSMLPWIVGEPNGAVIPIRTEDGLLIASVRYSDNPRATLAIAKETARLIVTAAHSHAALVQALREVLEIAHHPDACEQGTEFCDCFHAKTIRAAERALKLAGQGE